MSSVTTIQKNEEDDFQELGGIVKYIEVLLDSFPNPISRKELAQRTGVTEAAVSKVKDKLLRLCNWDALFLSRKLILKTDETFGRLLGFYFLQMKPMRVLLSNYGKEIIKRMNLHSKISESFKEYPLYFTEADTQILTRIVLCNLGNFQIANAIRAHIREPRDKMIWLSGEYIFAMQTILQKLELPMDNNDDLRNILSIRDKLFYLVKELLWRQVQKASILANLTTDKKASYIDVYSDTLDFYLRKAFMFGTKFIKQNAERRQLEFKDEYENIGCFFAPLPK